MSNIHKDELGDTHIATLKVEQGIEGSEDREPYPLTGLDLAVFWRELSGEQKVERAIVSRDDAEGVVTVVIDASHPSSSHKDAEYRLRATDGKGHVNTLAIWRVKRG